jgi:hypothetical protein
LLDPLHFLREDHVPFNIDAHMSYAEKAVVGDKLGFRLRVLKGDIHTCRRQERWLAWEKGVEEVFKHRIGTAKGGEKDKELGIPTIEVRGLIKGLGMSDVDVDVDDPT